jgi:hypothetical protein
MNTKCAAGEHKYEPRYDELPMSGNISSRAQITAQELRSIMVRRVYVCDVCVQCGDVVRIK